MNTAVFGLLYGDYPHLAQRLLRSWARWADTPGLVWHIGLNKVCDESLQYVNEFHVQVHRVGAVNIHYGADPYYKYPLMRRMFKQALADRDYPADLFMWFDDDSHILESTPQTFFDDVRVRMTDADILGSIWYVPMHGRAQFIQDQPWYRGKCQLTDKQISFCTGGWWTTKAELMAKHDWPPVFFHHNGGDIMLGALCREQGYRMVEYSQYVGINCNETGKCSSAKRRGTSLKSIGVVQKEHKLEQSGTHCNFSGHDAVLRQPDGAEGPDIGPAASAGNAAAAAGGGLACPCPADDN